MKQQKNLMSGLIPSPNTTTLESRILALEQAYNQLRARLDICCPPQAPSTPIATQTNQTQNFSCSYGDSYDIHYYNSSNVQIGLITVVTDIDVNNVRFARIFKGMTSLGDIIFFKQTDNTFFTMNVDFVKLWGINPFNLSERSQDFLTGFTGVTRVLVVPV